MGAIAAPIISGVAGIGSSIASSSQSRRNTMDTNQALFDLQEREFSENLAQWNRENEYNTPTMQMQRLTDAGLNPNLVYGNGTVAGLTSAKSPQYSASKADYHNRQSPAAGALGSISQVQGIRLVDAQTDNVKAQNDLIKAQAAKTSIEAAREEFALKSEDFEASPFHSDGYYSNESGLDTARNLKRINLASAYRDSSAKSISNYINAREADFITEVFGDKVARYRSELDNIKRRGELYTAQTGSTLAEQSVRLKEAILKDLEIDLRKYGIQSGDAVPYRVLTRLLNKMFPELKF